MHIVISYAFTSMIILAIMFTTWQNMIGAFDDVTGSWTIFRIRIEDRADTVVTGPVGLSIDPASTVQITLSNEGSEKLGDFSDWDVIFEIQKSSSFEIAYLAYTTDASPSANEWTVSNIYQDANALTAEVVDIGIFNPGEDMIVLANPSPSVRGKTFDRATFVTPNGVSTKVIFEVKASLYVLDESDTVAYGYAADGTYLGAYTLDAANNTGNGITNYGTSLWTANGTQNEVYKYSTFFATLGTWNQDAANVGAVGITTDNSNLYIVDDDTADKVYKYSMTGTIDTNFTLDANNTDPRGIATDGTNIWVVDADANAYKYDMSGTYVTSFALDAANANPTGITTNGTNIWVVDDVDDKVYKYGMTGTLDSSFDLTAINSNPQGIAVGR